MPEKPAQWKRVGLHRSGFQISGWQAKGLCPTHPAKRLGSAKVGLADRVFVAHAAPASRTLALCEELQVAGKALFTVDDTANVALRGFAAIL